FDRVGFGNFDNQVWLTVRPLVLPDWSSRHVFGITLWRAAIDPPGDRRDLRIGETGIVDVAAYWTRGVKGRHLAFDDLLFDGTRPWPGLFVACKGHRGDAALVMALYTALVEDRGYVSRESERSLPA